MNSNLLFSILVAQYNNGTFFQDLYDSLIQQTYKNWECIIVDDKSTDDSLNIIRKLTKNDNRFIIIENAENKGTGFTKRMCVENATGGICGFVDPDDVIVPNAIETMVEAHLEYKDTTMVYSNFITCDSDLNKVKTRKSTQIKNQDNRFINTEYKIQHFCSFKREHYLKTEGINPRLKRAVDQDLYLKLYEINGAHYIDKDLYLYRIHDHGISSGSGGKAKYWHWMVIMDAGKRRGIEFENEFIEFIQDKFVYPKLHPMQGSFFYTIYKIENKLKSIFSRIK